MTLNSRLPEPVLHEADSTGPHCRAKLPFIHLEGRRRLTHVQRRAALKGPGEPVRHGLWIPERLTHRSDSE